jgi:hypothetical protein
MTDLKSILERIDSANAPDPNRFGGEPLAREQGRLAHGWVLRLDPHAGDAIQIAARAHHLQRWELARSDYPAGRDGYLRWRRDQKKRHAELLSTLLATEDLTSTVRARSVDIVQKKGLGSDSEVQLFEDAVCLTFIETQFLETAERLADDDKMVDVVAKTFRKMSPAGIDAAGTIALDERAADIVRRAAMQLD